MKLTESSNPVFQSNAFKTGLSDINTASVMTVQGTVNKTILLTLLVVASAAYAWVNPNTMFMWVGMIGGLITALVTIFRPRSSGISAPVYALFQGLFLGSISLVFETQISGIVFQAVTGTIGVLFMMLFLYRSGIIKVTQRLRMGIVAATGGIFLMYMINWIISLFGGGGFLSLQDTSLMAIGINLVVVAVAALNLVLDFDFIDRGAAARAPKYMEWFGAFGIMVTLIWLYLELLKLLSRLNSRD